MQCPVCSKEIPDGSKACPNCNADLSRWRPKTESDSQDQSAVIIEQREILSFRSRIQPLLPYLALVGLFLLFSVLAYLGARWYISYSAGQDAPSQTNTDVTEKPQQYEIQLSTAGLTQVLQEYRERAGAMKIAALEEDAIAAFQAGAEQVGALTFRDMEEAGFTTEGEPFTPEETERDRTAALDYKCTGSAGTEYPAGLPSGATDYVSCWVKQTITIESKPLKKTKKSPPPSVSNKWIPAQWTQELKRWSPWTASQLLTGAEKYAEKHFSAAAIAADNEKAKLLEANSGKQEAGSDASQQFFETYRLRFMREGFIAALERLRLRRTETPQTQPSSD